MGHRSIGFAVAIAAVAAAVFVWRLGSHGEPGNASIDAREGASRSTRDGRDPPPAADASALAASPERSAVEESPVATRDGTMEPGAARDGAETECRVTGRCVTTGQPQRGAHVEIWLGARKNPTGLRAQDTTDDGRFDLRIALGPKERPQFRASHGRAARGGELITAAPGTVVDLGDVELLPTCTIRGIVRDLAGQTVASARIIAKGRESGDGAGVTSPGGGLDRPLKTLLLEPLATMTDTDPEGRYEFREMIGVTWTLQVVGLGIGGSAATVDTWGRSLVEQDLLVKRYPSIRGRVLRRNGTPMNGVRILARAPESNQLLAGSSVGQDGAFVVRRMLQSEFGGLAGADLPEGDAVDLVIEDDAVIADPVRARWGDEDVVVRVSLRGVIRLRVLADDTGEVFTHFAIRAGAGPELGGFEEFTAEDGVARVLGMGEGGRRWLTVIPDRPYQTLGPIAVDPHVDEEVPLDVRVPRAPRIVVRVLTGANAPIAGASVQLASVLAGRHAQGVVPGPSGRRSNILDGRLDLAYVWDQAETDADGRATVELPALEGRDLWAVATVEGRGERRLRVGPARPEWEVVFQDGAIVDVELAGIWPEPARVRWVCLSDPTQVPVPAGAGMRLADAPRQFAVPLPAPGTWEARLMLHTASFALGRIDARIDARSRFRIDADAILKDPLPMRVTRGGQGVADGVLVLDHRVPETGAWECVGRYPIAAGTAELPALPHAEYRAYLEGEAAGPPLHEDVWTQREIRLPH